MVNLTQFFAIYIKKIVKATFFICLLNVGLAEARTIQRASLDKVIKAQELRDAVEVRSNEEIVSPANVTPDRFTQTEAHLHLKKNRDLIEKYYNVEPYLDVISTVIANEEKYKNTHYAFYNTTSNMWRLAQDLFTRLYAYEHPEEVTKEFKFLRFNDEAIDSTAQGFLVSELKSKGLVDDNTATGAILLSVNLSLFGNVGFPGECSWQYFVKPQSHKFPERATYEKMMDRFGMSHKYINELMSLVKLYDTNEDTIIQILVPRDKIDEIGYLAWVRGIPAHGDTIQWIVDHAKSKSFKHTKPTMEKLVEDFKKKQEKNPLFASMLQGVQAGEFSLDDFLKIYRNKPWDIKEINDVTARLLFTPNVLLNPKSDVKFFRFSTVKPDSLKTYNKRLNDIIDKLIAEKEAQEVKKVEADIQKARPSRPAPKRLPLGKK